MKQVPEATLIHLYQRISAALEEAYALGEDRPWMKYARTTVAFLESELTLRENAAKRKASEGEP